LLKLGSVRWRGKCSRHPRYNPAIDGMAGIRGNCPKCNQLLQIFTHHSEALRLMRTFAPIEEKPKAVVRGAGAQQSLFA